VGLKLDEEAGTRCALVGRLLLDGEEVKRFLNETWTLTPNG
jgi:hypothetical protein